MEQEATLYGNRYIEKLIADIKNIPMDKIAEIAKVLQQAQQNGKRVFIFGNGGSAAMASHMACDFGKNTRKPEQSRLRVISLVDGLSALTAYANDEGYENVFSEPLLSLAEAGDVALAISGSGSSPNVIKGIETAKQLGLITIGLTGFQGGKLNGLVDKCLVVNSNNMERIEDVHLIINHILTGLLRGSEWCNN